MIRSNSNDKELVTANLASSFDDNKSVNYLLPQDTRRHERIQKFMEYSFDVCHHFGDVFLSDDRKGCALILMPDKTKTNVQSILFDVKFNFSINRIIKREES